MNRSARRNLRGLLVLAAALPLALVDLVGTSTPARSTNLCGYVRNRVVTTVSVTVTNDCTDEFDPRCYPGFPFVGGDLLAADFFVCLHWT